MLKITDNQKQLLLEHLPTAAQCIEDNDIEQLLEGLDDKITEVGFEVDYELNEIGLKLQQLYDQIYSQN